MKRLIISLTIIVLIIAVGIYALYSVSTKNDRLYGHIEAVLSAYEEGGDVIAEIQDLRDYFEGDYVRCLGMFVNDDLIGGLLTYIDRLEPMYKSECDEFPAECAALKTEARKIYLNELPSFFRIL